MDKKSYLLFGSFFALSIALLLLNQPLTHRVFAQTCDVYVNGICYYNGMDCSLGGCSNPYDYGHCRPPYNIYNGCVTAYSVVMELQVSVVITTFLPPLQAV